MGFLTLNAQSILPHAGNKGSYEANIEESEYVWCWLNRATCAAKKVHIEDCEGKVGGCPAVVAQ